MATPARARSGNFSALSRVPLPTFAQTDEALDMNMIITSDRAERPRRARGLVSAAALMGLAALSSACAGGDGAWTVSRNGDMAVASLSGASPHTTTPAALAGEATRAVKSSTGCEVERLGPAGGPDAKYLAKLACGG